MKPIRKFPFLAAAFIALSILCCTSQTTQASEHSPTAEIPKWCADMVKMHEDFLKLLKNQDAELATQAEKMKSAPDDQKNQLIEATLLLMIQQQTAQHSEMEKIVVQMKNYMGKNKCPMMQREE
jgi:phosphate uptake regulator